MKFSRFYNALPEVSIAVRWALILLNPVNQVLGWLTEALIWHACRKHGAYCSSATPHRHGTLEEHQVLRRHRRGPFLMICPEDAITPDSSTYWISSIMRNHLVDIPVWELAVLDSFESRYSISAYQWSAIQMEPVFKLATSLLDVFQLWPLMGEIRFWSSVPRSPLGEYSVEEAKHLFLPAVLSSEASAAISVQLENRHLSLLLGTDG